MPENIVLTPATAPRTVEELVKFTPIELRTLTEMHLAGLRSPEERMSWFNLKTMDAKATYILTLLKRWDDVNANGVAPAASEPAKAAVARTPVVVPAAANGVAPAAVGQEALAAAVAATAGKQTTRQPRSTAKADAPADVSADVINLLTRILDGQTGTQEYFSRAQAQVLATIEDATASKTSRVTALEASYEALNDKIATMSDMLNAIMKTQVWALMAILNAQNGTTVDILRCAINDSETFQELVNIARGKA